MAFERADRRDAPIDLTGRRPRIGYISSDLRDHAVELRLDAGMQRMQVAVAISQPGQAGGNACVAS